MKKNEKLKAVEHLFETQKIANIDDLYKVLKTSSRATVFRYLCQLDYISSYTHSSRYYSLPTIAQFDKNGLWSVGDICFSKYRTLLESLVQFISQSETGKTNSELEEHCNGRAKLDTK